jgi:hypothetical protein
MNLLQDDDLVLAGQMPYERLAEQHKPDGLQLAAECRRLWREGGYRVRDISAMLGIGQEAVLQALGLDGVEPRVEPSCHVERPSDGGSRD